MSLHHLTKSVCFKIGICLLPLVTEETDMLGAHTDLKSPNEPQTQDVTEPVEV